jgi:hypothetical protein
MSDDLVARLRHAWDERERQLAEDERVAREAPGPAWHRATEREGEPGRWRGIKAQLVTLPPDRPHPLLVGDEVASCAKYWAAEHIARHDPARVLAEVERGRRDIAAKRRILDLHPPRDLGRWQVCAMCRPVSEYPDDVTSETWPCRTLQALAEAEADA